MSDIKTSDMNSFKNSPPILTNTPDFFLACLLHNTRENKLNRIIENISKETPDGNSKI